MSESNIQCVKIDSQPYAFVLPKESIAQVLETPEIVSEASQQAAWMSGYVLWNGQEIPLMCIESLVDATFERPQVTPSVVILNPMPKTARKSYGAILSFGEVKEIKVPDTIEDAPVPEDFDRRYCEAAFTLHGETLIIPRLAALGVAFSYF